jgi:hypothetical protein
MKRRLFHTLGALLTCGSLVFLHSGATLLAEEAPLAALVDGLLAILLIYGGSLLEDAEPQETPHAP